MRDSEEFCAMCGHQGVMTNVRPNTANDQACGACNATLRYRGQAAAILSHFGKGGGQSLYDLVKTGGLDDISILEMALRGPLVRRLHRLRGYVQSYYWEGVDLGSVHDGVICQDITSLTFDDNSFDLIISSDVMEHVHDPWKGFSEVARCLKVGGVYIFTIPVRLPFREFSITRATLDVQSGDITHFLPEVYHQSGEKDKTLVFTDFGADIFNRCRKMGMHLSFESPSSLTKSFNRFGCFAAVKLGDE